MGKRLAIVGLLGIAAATVIAANPVQNRITRTAVSYDVDALTWKANVYANGGTVSTATLKAISDFCKGCKADGTWTKMQEVYPFAGDQLAAALTKLKYVTASAYLTNNNFVSGDYAETGSTAGLKGNGTSKYLDSGFNPVSQSSSTSSFHLSAYVKGTESGGTSRLIVGGQAASGINPTHLGWYLSGAKEGGGIAAADATNGAPGTSTVSLEGALLVTTNGNRSQTYYKNGAQVSTPVTATGSFTSNSLFVSAINNGGAAAAFSTRYFRGLSIGTGLAATDVSNLYTRWQVFEAALSRNL